MRTSRLWPGLIVGGAVLLVCAPFLLNAALPIGSDVYSTVHYVEGFHKALIDGDWYPRWTERTNQDLGSPSFVLFPPFFYYLASAGWGATGGFVPGIKLAVLIIVLLSALAFHLLARDWIGPGVPAAAATALYVLLPYHLLDIYQRFAMSESAAFIFFPLILLFASRALRTGRGLDAACLALSYAGLCYTHVVSTFIFSIFLGPWLLWEARGRLRTLIGPIAALACGAGLAAPAILPALVEKSHVNIQWTREMPNGDFVNNFIFRDDPIPGLGYRDPVKPPVFKSAHSELLLAAAGAVIALAWGADDRRRRLAATCAAGCALAYFLQLEISTLVWRAIPELPTIQFPWRFQTMMVLAAALLSGFAIEAIRGGGRSGAARGPGAAALAVLAVLALVNLLLAAQNAYLKPFVFDAAQGERQGVADWVAPEFTPVAYMDYKDIKKVRLDFPRAAFTEGMGEITVSRWATSRRTLHLQSALGGSVQVHTFWFPGWTATLDGEPLAIAPAPPYGAINFKAPPGSHIVELIFGSTPPRRAGWWVGAFSVLLTALLAWAPRRRAVRTPEAS
jgi:hypothetical protein